MTLKRPDREPAVQRYYPDVIAPAKEFKKLAAAENPELKLAADGLWKWFSATFVYYADEDGIERWEDMLGIRAPADASIEARRLAILSRINNNTPYTERWIRTFYDMIYGPGAIAVTVTPADYALRISGESEISRSIPRAIREARMYAPANLTVRATITYRNNFKLLAGIRTRIKETVHIYPASSSDWLITSPTYVGVASEFSSSWAIGGD